MLLISSPEHSFFSRSLGIGVFSIGVITYRIVLHPVNRLSEAKPLITPIVDSAPFRVIILLLIPTV